MVPESRQQEQASWCYAVNEP